MSRKDKATMTIEQAKKLADSKFWEPMTHRQRAEFQMANRLLCMPFPVFHEAVEKTLGRPVWTHEMALNWDGLAKELRGEAEPPTMEQIINMIPEDKRLLVTT